MRWVGHIIRMEEGRTPRKALEWHFNKKNNIGQKSGPILGDPEGC